MTSWSVDLPHSSMSIGRRATWHSELATLAPIPPPMGRIAASDLTGSPKTSNEGAHAWAGALEEPEPR